MARAEIMPDEPPDVSVADPRVGRRIVKLGPGDYAVTREPDILLLTVLGSCVAACIRDPVAGVGGMNHFMLPESTDGRWGRASASLRYGNFAMEQLINDILRQGGRRERLEVKLFGGARIGADTSAIGTRNARYVEEHLKAEGMASMVRELGGEQARRLAYLPVSGRAFVVILPRQEIQAVAAELSFSRALRRSPVSGSVELWS